VALLVWMVVGCGSSEPGTIRSQPTAPTAEIGGKVLEQPEIVWTDLTDVFPTTPCAPPARLGALAPGAKGADAHAALDAAHLPGTRMTGDVRGGKLVVNGILDGHPNVTVMLVLDEQGEALEEIQVSVPKDEALAVLAARWGAPTSTEFQPDDRSIYRWSAPGAPWAVEILPSHEGKEAIIRYHRP
jgi:hypothetical protein